MSKRRRSKQAPHPSHAVGRGPVSLQLLEPRMMFDGAAVATAVGDNLIPAGIDAFVDADLSRIASAIVSGGAAGPAHAAEAQRPALADKVAADGDVAPNRDSAAGAPITTEANPPIGAFGDWRYKDSAAIDADSVAAQAIGADGTGRSFIFIDTNVAGYEQLVAEWTGQGTIVLIDSARDGIDQMMTALAGVDNIDAIHIVSHGGDGYFSLGSTRIDQAAVVGDLASSFAAIGAKLSADADILIYGCDVGAGEAGQRLLDTLALATGADIAASVDDTGAVLRGGDWTLENRLGVVENATLVSREWDGLLAAPATIRLSATTVLRVFNAAGVEIANSSTGVGFDSGNPPRTTAIFPAGSYAIWTNAGLVNGQPIDLRADIISNTSSGSSQDGLRFDRPNLTNIANNVAGADDPGFLLQSSGSSGIASIGVRWTLLAAGTATPVVADVTFAVADIDGSNTSTPGTPSQTNQTLRESLTVSTDTLAGYESASPTNIRFFSNANSITATGTANENGGAISAARFTWQDTSSFVITYNANRALTVTAGFSHDGDRDLVIANGVSVSIPRIDLDRNDSTTSGSGYRTAFTENGAAVGIVDSDLLISNPVGNVQGATVTLTNAQLGDAFLVNGSTAASGTLAGGISYTIVGNVIQLTGPASATAYENALRAITFTNTSENPSTVDRNVTIGFANSTLNSNLATTTINVVSVNDAPSGADATLTTNEDTPITLTSANFGFTDPLDNNAFQGIRVGSLPVGSLLLNGVAVTVGQTISAADIAAGRLTWLPPLNTSGTALTGFNFQVQDNGGTANGGVNLDPTANRITFNVNPVNDTPVIAAQPSYSGTEDAPLTINGITMTDVDAGTASVSLTISVPAGVGTLAFASTPFLSVTQTGPNSITVQGQRAAIESAVNGGALTFTPTANFNGTTTATFVFNDRGNTGADPGLTANATSEEGSTTAAIVIAPVNDAPTRVGTLPPQSHVDAASGINVPTAQGFTDIDNASLTYSASGLPAGLSINPATGAITGTIDRSASQGGAGGVYSVIVTATDAGGLSTTQTFSWTITNPPPVAVNDGPLTTAEDTPIASINVRANDSDPDGDPIAVVSATAANGTVTINPDGTLRYVPNANFSGTDSITYTISDGQGGTATATVAVTITPVNDAPVPVGSLPPQTHADAATGISVPTAQGFADVDGPTATYSATGLPAGLTIDSATGVISGTIDRSASQGGTGGVYNVVITRSDGAATATQTFSWTVTNPVPIATNDSVTTPEDTPITVNVLGNDSDPDGDPLTVIAAAASIGTARVVANQVQYTPPANFNGTATITYTISDGQGGTATATLTVTVTAVNDAPVATPIAPVSTVDGASISLPVAPSFSDPEGNPLTFAATGLPPGLSINPTTGVISGTVAANASQTNGGVYTATITASDGNGGSVTQTITLNVANPGPTAANDSASTPEDTPVTISPLANDSDPDGDPLTITAASAQNGTVTINANGTITYTPNPGFNGTDTISYEVSDGNGGTSTATITVAVADVNDAPLRTGTIANQTNLDSQVISLPVAGAFSDPDGDPLSYTATGLPAGLTINAATGVISGTIDRSASQANGGVYTIAVTASDGRGGTITQTFSWTVTNPVPGAVNDSATTSEDTPVNIPVLANDADPDGDPLTVTQASAGNGTVTINPDGSLVYTPNPNFNGTDTILYTITDSEGGVSTASVSVIVNPVNDAPTSVGLPNQNGDDGASVSFSVAGAFADPDGDPLSFSATGLPPNLTLDPATGLISGTLAPETSVNGPYVVTVTATDPSGAQVTTSFVYSVQNVPPVAVNDVASTPEDVPVTVAVLTNDSDPDGDPLTITSASANNGTVAINPDGTLTFTPALNFNGVATVSYTVSDGQGGIATATLTVTVGPVNDAPTSLPIPNQASVDGAFYSANVSPFFDDIDGDTLTFSATGLPAGLSIDPATGLVSGTIDRNASQVNGGVYTVTITATDPGGASVSRTLTATVTNPAPTATNDAATTDEDVAVAIPVLANDTDPDSDPLTITAASALNGTVSIGSGGVLTYTPNPNFNGTDTIIYVISDGNGGTSTAAVTVTVNPVNDAPVAVNDVATTNEDTPVTLDPLANDGDGDGDPLTITSATSPNGTVTINPDGTITFTPNANFNGPTTISYTISDGKGGTSTATINVTVDAINDPPVANPSTATTSEDTPVNVPVLANDSDIDGNPLTVTSASAPNGSVTINPDGTVTYTPNANFNGTDTITYTISDGQGGFSTSTVTVTVNAANDAPTATPIAPQTNDDADGVNFPVAGNFADLDGDTLSYAATGLPAGLTIDPVTGVISGTIDRSASQVNGGVYSVTVTASDGNGAAVSTTFSWTVQNPPPVASNDAATTNEDTPVTIPVLTNDSDPDADPLTVTSAISPNGTVAINPDGTITFTPAPNFNGPTTITYTISDGQGGTSTATVAVSVNAVNDAPVIDAPLPSVAGVDGSTANLPTAGNFSDLDGDTLSFMATGLPAGLTINPATGVISGTIDRNASQGGPNADGIYSVTVTASDGNGGTVSSTFTYTVTNPGPTATNDNATTAEDIPVTVNVLANDSDPDNDPLTVTAATSPDGVVTINPDGTLTFIPAANFKGPTTISYTISDGNGGSSTATVTVNVTPVNDAPTVTPVAPQSNPDSDAVSLPVAANFNDLDGDALTFSATGLPAGLSIDPVTGIISGTIAPNASQANGGAYIVTVTANDGAGGAVSTSFSWTVTNPPPRAANDGPIAATEDVTLTNINVLGNDSDPDGDPLTVTAASSPNGTVTINPDGTLNFTPAANFNGLTTISYTISDGNGGSATATVTINVAAVNDAPVVDAPLIHQANPDGATVSVPTAGSFSDLDDATLAYSVTGLPAGLSINPTTGVISGTIAANASQPNGGVYTVTVRATDASGGFAESTFTWTVNNPPPVAENDQPVAATEDIPVLNINVLGNDSDPDGDPLTVTAASSPNGTVTINPDGTLNFTPAPNFNGPATITYTISDGNGGFDTAIVTVNVAAVNDAPTTVGLPNLFDIDSAGVSIPVAAAFADIDSTTLTYSAGGTLPPGLGIDPATGLITGTLAANASTGGPGGNGIYAVTITASDGAGGTVSTTFTWTITNTAPVAVDDVATTAEETPVTIDVLVNDSDPVDGDPLRVVSATATNGTVVVNTNGTLTFTPAANFNGTATVTYLITDDEGGFSTATAVITVTPVNDAPTASPLPDLTNSDADQVTIPTASAFADSDGNTLSYSATGLPAGLDIDPATGEITGRIDGGASQPNGGTYTVTVRATDPSGAFVETSFTWTVNNPGPTAVNDAVTTDEDTPVTFDVRLNDTDPDSDALTVVGASAGNGTVTIDALGLITYTPNANFNGTDTITYTISDGNGGFSTATVTVTVSPQNDAPTAAALPARSNTDSTAITNLSVASGFSDPDGNPLTFAATGLPTGLTMDAAGNITGTIAANASQNAPNGIFTVTATASDGQGGSVSTSFSWTVTNPPPVANDDGPIAATEDAPVTIAVLANDSDPDGDPLTVTAATSPDGTVVINGDGTITFTPNIDFFGPTTISYTVSDGNGGTSSATVTVNVAPANDAPTATPIPARSNVDSAVVSVPVAGNFDDLDGDTLSFSATGLPAGLAIDPATGVISGTIAPGASQINGGVYSVTVTASDGNGGTVSTTFAWTVTNPPPVAVNDVASTPEDVPVNINVLANDSDPDGDTLTVTTASAANGTVVILPNGTIDYTPGPNFNGTDTITYTISDGNGGTATATVAVTVGPANDPPVAIDDAASTNEDTPVTIAVLANDNDIDGNPLAVTAATSLNGTVVINPDGTITFTPAPNFNGVATINYTVSDGQGGFDTAKVTVDVNPVNDPPVAANDSATTPEDTPVTVAVLANDSDVDGDNLTVTSATSPDGAVTINPNGTITFAPNANFNGPTTISYAISDGNGGTSTATVTLTVSPVNDLPVANPSTATTSEDMPVVLPVLANDSDADGDPLTVTAASAANGTVTILPDGTVRYTPNANFNGIDTVTYTISDGRGGTATSTVTVTVSPVNDVPVAVNDNATTSEETPVTIPVLGNDSDADGNPLTVTAATSPNGSVAINPDGTITFTPNANFNGPATISYTISDGQGGTATATVAVIVTPVNDPPVALNDSANGTEDTPLRISPLANDSDADGNPLTIVSASSPNGSVTINPDGTITFTPDPNFNGPTTISYQVSDGRGGFATATINVTIAPVNDPPVARNDVFTMDEDTTARIPVLVNDTDADGDPLTVTQASSPNGSVAINPDGTINFTPAPNFFGPATITYTISDGRGGTSTATATVNVVNVNEPPVDGDEAVLAIGGAPRTIAVLDNATDPDRDPLTVFFAEVESGSGTVVLNPDGTISYTAPPEYQGIAVIRYIVSDGKGGFDISFVTVTVTQATADLNALLGPRTAGVPDGWLVDAVRDQSAAFITTPLVVLDTANAFRGLNGTTDLGVGRPLLTAVNGLGWLRGTPEHDADGHPIAETVAHLDRIRDLRFGQDRLFDPRWGDFMIDTLTGFSVRQLDTGVDRVMIDSVVRDRVIYMEIKDVGKDGDPRVVEFQLRTRDGSPLPNWIRMDRRGLAIIERPVDAQEIRLIVRAIDAAGKVIDIPVVVQGATGEIQLDEKLADKKISAGEPLSRKLATASAAATDEAARLAAAFASQA